MGTDCQQEPFCCKGYAGGCSCEPGHPLHIDLGPAVRNIAEPGLLPAEPLAEPSMVRFGRIAGNVLFWFFLSMFVSFAINFAAYLCRK